MKIQLAGNSTTWGYPPMRFDDLDRWRSYLDEVAAAGFDGIEHLPPMAPDVDPLLLRQELRQRDLALAGIGHYGALETAAGRASLESQLDVTATFVVEVGADYLYVIDEMYIDPFSGKLKRPVELDVAGWATMIENLYHLDARARELCNLPLLLHPHQYTHVETIEQIERFLAGTDPDRVSILFDTGHYTVHGGDPADFYRRHHDRIGHLHLMNVDLSKLTDPEAPLPKLVETGAFADLTAGDVDFRALHETLSEFDYAGWSTVEMLRLPEMPDNPVDVARKAVEYLRGIGYVSS